MLNTKILVDVFDPRDFLNDPRVAFDLVWKGENMNVLYAGIGLIIAAGLLSR